MKIYIGDTFHKCTGYRYKDKIIFSCSDCDYRRIINFKTGEITVENSKPFIHSGEYFDNLYKSCGIN